MVSDDPRLSRSSYLNGSVYLVFSFIGSLFYFFEPLEYIGPGDPLTSLFLLFIGIIYIRGGYLTSTGNEQGRGYVLSAFLAGVLLTFVVSIVWIAGVMDAVIISGVLPEDPIDAALISVLAPGILSIILSLPYRNLLHGRKEIDQEKEESKC